MGFSVYTLYFMLLVGTFGAFLEDKLPLKVLSITPNELTRVGQTSRQAALLKGIDPITVVFTRPVIALGSDFQALNTSVQGGLGGPQNPFTLVDLQGRDLNVSGKLRWPTTYIARFDPDATWPTDLEFTLNLNPNLQSYDGVTLAISDPAPAFQTPFLSGSFTAVDSKTANNLTGGAWSPTVGTETEPEVPPDGEIRYEFSNPVNIDLLRNAFTLSIKQGDIGSASVRFAPCPPRPRNPIIFVFDAPQQQQQKTDLSSCVLIRPSNLAPDASYMLTLPTGTVYHQNAGATHKPLTFIFHGLYPFTFTPQSFQPWSQPRYRRLDFYLRHGLQANQDAALWRRALTISNSTGPIPYSVSQLDNVTLRVEAPLQPSQTYNVAFANAPIKDGFGQMFRGVNFSFTTSQTNAIFQEPVPNDNIVFSTTNAPNSWKWMTRSGAQQQPITLSLGGVQPGNFVNSLNGRGYQASQFPTSISSRPATTDFVVQNLTRPSNFFLRQRAYAAYDGSTTYQGSFASITDLGVSAISSATSAGGTLDVWVTNMSTGANVPGASVYIYMQQPWNSQSATLLASSVTGPDGTVTMQIVNNSVFSLSGQFLLYVTKQVGNGIDQTFVEFYPSSSSQSSTNAAIVTDRGVYKPGDTINLKVFATKRDGQTTTPFTEAGCNMQIQWEQPQAPNWQPTEQTIPVNFDPTFGTWFTSLEIPANTTFGSKTMSIVSSTGQWISSAPVLIADPRRPTASLEFNVDSTWVIGDPLNINATVMTGTEQPISNAKVDVAWTLQSGRYGASTSGRPTNGSFTLTTGADGTANKQDFSINGIQSADYVNFVATYVGPTGEVMTESSQATVATSKWTMTLEPATKFNTLTSLPGFAFGWIVHIFNQNGKEVGGSGTINLYTPNSNVANSTCQFNQQAGNSAPVCTGFSLPSVGAFVAVASVTDNRQHPVTANYSLGRSADEWKTSPLNKYSVQNFQFELDNSSYAVGDTARVLFDCPFSGATVWLKMNGLSLQSPVTSGRNQVSFRVPQQCFGGCALSITVSIPAQSSSAFASQVRASGVPVSTWLDLQGPRAFQGTLQMDVPDTTRQLNVAITPPPKSQPGDSVKFSVKLTDQNNAPVTGEVAIFVVDRAFLQVSPYPLVHLNESLAPSSHDYRSPFDNRQSITAWSGARASLDTFTSRLSRDPWVEYSENDVDASDADFFRGLSFRVTEWGQGNSFIQNRGDMMMGGMASRMVSAPMMMAMSVRVPAAMSVQSFGAEADAAAMPAPMMGKMAATGSAGPASTTAPVRTKFETTPLFIGRRVVQGTGSFDLKLPDNIGTFTIRAYAVDAKSRFGQAEAQVVTTKPLTIQPMFPRFARPGDVFDAGVIVTGDSANYNNQVTVSVAAENSTVVITDVGGNSYPSRSTQVAVQGTTPVKVRFPMAARKVGDAYFQFTAKDPNNAQDAFEDKFPVHPTQDNVIVATSMAIQASPAGQRWDEGIALPPMVPGSGSLGLNAAVGRLPTIETLASVVLNSKQQTNPDQDAYLWLSRALIRNVFTRYPNAAGPVETLARDQFPGVVAALQRLTDPQLGLRWSNQYAPSIWETSPDASLNFYGMYVAFRSYLQRSLADVSRLPFSGVGNAAPSYVPNSAQNGKSRGPNGDPQVMVTRMPPNTAGMSSPAPPMMARPGRGLLQQQPQPDLQIQYIPPPPTTTQPLVEFRPGQPVPPQLAQQPQFQFAPDQPQRPQPQPQPQQYQSQQPTDGLLPLDLVQVWAVALERALVTQYYDSVRYGQNFSNWDLLAQTLTVLGLDWTAPKLNYSPSSGPLVPADANPGSVLNLQNLQANQNKLSYGGQVQLALAYVLRGQSSNPLVSQVVNQTLARILVQGRTAYLKTGPGSNNAAPTEMQAAALELLAITNSNHPFVEKLANYLAQGNAGNAGSLYSFSSKANAISCLAFAVYDQAKQNMNANATLKVSSGSKSLLEASFQGANSHPVTARINPDTLPQQQNRTAGGSVVVPQGLQFVAQGQGEVSVAALIDFVPAQISPDPIYRGIYVERTIQKSQGGKGTGPALQLVQEGDFVVVTVQITSPDDLTGVLIQDLLPGGLEAVDPRLNGGATTPPPIVMPFMPTYARSGSRFIWPPWRDPFGPAVVYPDRVTWQANSLRQGTYSVSYTAVAVTTGTFLHPPTKVISVAQPEVMGLSGGGYFVVSEDLIALANQQQYLRSRNVPLNQPLTPRECKTPCPSSGFCNLRTGQCQEVSQMQTLTSASTKGAATTSTATTAGKSIGKVAKAKAAKAKAATSQAPGS